MTEKQGGERGREKGNFILKRAMAFQQLPLPVCTSLPPHVQLKSPALFGQSRSMQRRASSQAALVLVSRNSPNTFTTSLLARSGSKVVREKIGANGKGGEGGVETGLGQEMPGVQKKQNVGIGPVLLERCQKWLANLQSFQTAREGRRMR